MRMIGIGLLGFLLAGIALLLSTMDILEKGQRYLNKVTTGPVLVFESRAAELPQGPHSAVIHRAAPNHPIILSGLPAYQGVVFHMPLGARPTSGYLQINATSQILDGVEGVLRISIDNIRRGEMLLRPGEVGRIVRIPLSPTDFARETLVVSFSLQGRSPQTVCSTDDGLAAVVEIETTSAVYLTLDRPLDTPRDRVNAWGRIMRVAWPHWLTEEERLRRLILATQSQQHGVQTHVMDAAPPEALSTVELRAALPFFLTAPLSASTAPEGAQSEPQNIGQNTGQEAPPSRALSLAQSGPNAGLRRFHRQTTWRSPIDLRQGGGQPLPAALSLHLALGTLATDGQWAVTITLNDRLVHHALLDRGQRHVDLTVALPPEMFRAGNTLAVTAASTHVPQGVCTAGPELVAEMLPQTRLTLSETLFSDGLTQVRAALADLGPLSLGASRALTAGDAERASALLAQIIDPAIRLKPGPRAAQLIVLPPDAAALTLPATGALWLVTFDPLSRMPVARALRGGDVLTPSGLSVLVVPAGIDLPGVAL